MFSSKKKRKEKKKSENDYLPLHWYIGTDKFSCVEDNVMIQGDVFNSKKEKRLAPMRADVPIAPFHPTS